MHDINKLENQKRSTERLGDDEVARFHRDGYVVVPAVVAPARVEALRRAFDELLDTWSAECGVTRERYLKVVSQWTNLWERHPAFAEQLRHPQVIAIAQQLLGVSALRLFHDHIVYKPPPRGKCQSGVIPWHQDFAFWPVDRPRALSCWLALDDAVAASGAVWFMPGAHREGPKPAVDFLHAPKDWGPRERDARVIEVPAGGAVFHSCLSWHMSQPNTSDRPRRAYIAILLDADCRWCAEHASWHPMNKRVTVSRGERFNDDVFPRLSPRDDAQEVL